jgi:alpha-D-ribose 1-methylphosphonate 5-triphosphate synthase subunit PhnI
LEKYGKEKARLREEREFMLAHIEELENSGFSQQLKDIHSYRLKAAEEDQGRLREELQRKKTEREKELLQQIESLI